MSKFVEVEVGEWRGGNWWRLATTYVLRDGFTALCSTVSGEVPSGYVRCVSHRDSAKTLVVSEETWERLMREVVANG